MAGADPAVGDVELGDGSEMEDENVPERAAGRRSRDASDTSPGKPRKGPRRTVSEGAAPHGF